MYVCLHVQKTLNIENNEIRILSQNEIDEGWKMKKTNLLCLCSGK